MMEQPPFLQFAAYRFLLTALEPIHLPPNAGSTLRGGFGGAFRRIACFQRNRAESDCSGCSVSHNCPYGYIFETRLPPDSQVLRAQNEIPHPFVLEPPENPPPVYQPGDGIEFRVVLVGRAIAYLPYFVLAFHQLGDSGIGRGRGRYRLDEVRAEHPVSGQWETIARGDQLLPCPRDLTCTFADLAGMCRGLEPGSVTVRFATPTRLVADGALVARPGFAVLVRAAMRRISSLSYFHCGRKWVADFPALVDRAAAVRTAESSLRWVDWERYSSRQDARIKLGGVMGDATYEGEVLPFLPLLLAAGAVHVGKACTFGNGRLQVSWAGPVSA